jgi:penicillin-binding protein 2
MPTIERSPLNLTVRVWTSLAVCAFCFFVLVIRLWYLQVIKGEFFRDRSENNRLRTIYVPAPRGLITDRHGEVLVRNRPSFNVDLVVEDSPDPKATIQALAQIIGEQPDVLLEKLSNQNKRRRFEPKLLLRDVSRDTVALIEAQRHRLPGIIVSVVPAREYVHGSLAAHLIGYIREISGEQLKNSTYSGYRPGELVGQYGIEAKLERFLQGERGSQTVVVNAMGNKIGEGFHKQDIPGSNITLTIDKRVQAAADKALEGKRGAVVALDARTGEILAMSSAPTFAPEMFTSEISKDQWADLVDPSHSKLTNRVIQGVYPPGSVFKIFVAIAALSEGVVTQNESTNSPGFLQFGKRSFRCHKHSGHGPTSLFEAMVQSCDVYFYTVGQRLGIDRIYHYAHDVFRFGETTGIDLAEENPGLIPSQEWKQRYFRKKEDQKWYPGETLPVAIGQGAVTTTPLQLATGLAAVVNGGNLLTPKTIRRVVTSDGRELQALDPSAEVPRRIEIEPWILAAVKKSLQGVVEDPRGTGHRAALPKASAITVGGKTGTAQAASREARLRNEDHAWFAGYAPADKPEIVVVALVESAGHGGSVAAPIVREVLAAHFGVTEDASVVGAKTAQ